MRATPSIPVFPYSIIPFIQYSLPPFSPDVYNIKPFFKQTSNEKTQGHLVKRISSWNGSKICFYLNYIYKYISIIHFIKWLQTWKLTFITDPKTL